MTARQMQRCFNVQDTPNAEHFTGEALSISSSAKGYVIASANRPGEKTVERNDDTYDNIVGQHETA